jgi:phage gp36-like protein
VSYELSPRQIVARFMASEVEYVQRLLKAHDIDEARAKTMLQSSAAEALKHCEPETVRIVTEVKRGTASFYIL